ncbi:clavesin-2-like isoform X2 [Schistocerca gregaria]|uniref:clavesin-2-like isoform X2 n=1 Tax=Schistocerca gregaria TaxID=7010 RepID=UPI00211EFF1D|nr:clavesin-2-like isoform X2 [Schistocerca gregaria]
MIKLEFLLRLQMAVFFSGQRFVFSGRKHEEQWRIKLEIRNTWSNDFTLFCMPVNDSLLKRFYEVKKNYPVHFEDCLPTEKGYVYDIEGLTVLDQCDNDERIVIVLRVEKADLKKVTIENLFQQLSTTLSFFLEDQHVQISGINIIMDLKGFGFKHLFALTPSSALLLTRLFQDCFPIRLKAIHVVNEPIFIGSLFSLFKPFIKEKLRKRIHFHGTNLSSLHAYLPYEILPRQLGGMVPDFNFTTFRRIFEENEDVIRGWRKFGYNKTLQNYIMK